LAECAGQTMNERAKNKRAKLPQTNLQAASID